MCTIAVKAETVEYDLTIAQEKINIAGKPALGMTLNGGIPGPTLYFKEGDTARIHVHNKMDEDTSIHWHGVLVPPRMDGVPYVSFPPIKSHSTFTYEFPVRQSGTYWYHSHTRLQEQSGVYGSIVIEPKGAVEEYGRDYVIVLSDWTDEDPHEVLRTLKRGSDWYALQKGSSQSILGAAKIGMLGDYFKRELQRMPPMDIADVAYDRFLANGKPEYEFHAEPKEVVRLRIIDGSSTTFFYLEFAGGPMRIISADGQPVMPVEKKRFLIAVAETYDVLVKIPGSGAYELRATAHDGSGYTSVWLGSGKLHHAPAVPKPNLYHAMMRDINLKHILAFTPEGVMGMPDSEVEKGKFDSPGMRGMGHMETADMQGHKMDEGPFHQQHMLEVNQQPGKEEERDASTYDYGPRSGKRYAWNFGLLAADVASSQDLAIDGISPERPGPPYNDLRSMKQTAFPQDKPAREVRLTLDGDMERYVWFMDNKPLSEADSILIKKGETVRFIMVNRTMMHHPMHLHGHFFRVINSQGDYAPFKHTVDVAPMSTTIIEFDADEVGDWFFHCHLLYHMKSGMANVVHYEEYALDPALAAIRKNLYKENWYPWAQIDGLSNMAQGFITFSDTRNILTAEWEVGWQDVDKTEWEGIFTYDRYFNRFFTLFAGVDLDRKEASKKTLGVLGFRYLLPLNIESRVWVDTGAGARINLGKVFQLTPRFALFGEGEYDTIDLWEAKAGFSYLISKDISIIGQWHSDYGLGAGLRIRL